MDLFFERLVSWSRRNPGGLGELWRIKLNWLTLGVDGVKVGSGRFGGGGDMGVCRVTWVESIIGYMI